jgi:cyclopropane fatty-acyl-phospholipid synthase-like methyltransferase
MLKFSDACERNKDPILKILKHEFNNSNLVLEIGSGTAQHAVYFGKHLSHLNWQPTDLNENLASIKERIELEATDNVKPPIELDVSKHPWPILDVDAVFTANTFHIMSWELVEHFFLGLGKILRNNGILCAYGPFKYRGKYTSESNEKFDGFLKSRDPQSGIRDFEAVDKLAAKQGLVLFEDHQMPANNQCIVWKR